MDRERARNYIGGHEGRSKRVYPDSEGYPTIGIGMNLLEERNKKRIQAMGFDYDDVCAGRVLLEEHHIDSFFDEDLDIAISDALTSVDNYWDHPEDAQLALVDMSFQLGGPRLKKFKNMVAALNATPPDYRQAAEEIADSLYAQQTPERAADNIALMRGCMA